MIPARPRPFDFGPPETFVDAHIHLWNLRGELDYGWLAGGDGGLLGTLSEAAIPTWDAARFQAETRFFRPAKTVHVQASDPPSDPVDETRWLASEQRLTGLPSAIIGRADLRSPDLGDVLDEHLAASPTFRGIRDMSTMGAIDDRSIRAGLVQLESRNLSWEVNSTWEQAKELIGIAREFPRLAIVYGHTGWPMERTPEYFAEWNAALKAISACENVICKVSGLGMTDHAWTQESMAPYVGAAIDAFGAQRCMFGSNWPVDRVYASYDALVTSVAAITRSLSPQEFLAFWAGTATRIYNLD